MKKHTIHVLLIITGWISFALGVLGIFLPVLPTTPFILLAAACFARSSERFHDWLLNHKYFGNIIKNFENGLGIEPRIRNRAIVIMWMGMISSMMIIYNIWAAVIISGSGILVTIYLFRLPAYQPPETIQQ
ncbi:MAG: YbaN family protein [Gammaproteobacteria bacterium]|nr:YbaN family protein [Gammaproteobacteria bacterium]